MLHVMFNCSNSFLQDCETHNVDGYFSDEALIRLPKKTVGASGFYRTFSHEYPTKVMKDSCGASVASGLSRLSVEAAAAGFLLTDKKV